MARYHINRQRGTVGRCTAQKRCPLGDELHYDTQREAEQVYEKEVASVHDVFEAGLRKNPRFAEMQRQVDYVRQRKQELHDAHIDETEPTIRFQGITAEELQAFNADYRHFENSLTPGEKTAFYDYAGISYKPINDYIEDPEHYRATYYRPEILPRIERGLQKQIDELDAAIAKAPARARRVFRRLDQPEDLGTIVDADEWARQLNFVVGEEGAFPRFSSTTADAGYIARTIHDTQHMSLVLVIDTHCGAPVSATHETGTITHTQQREREILLPRDFSYRVTRVERSSYDDGDEVCTALSVFMEQI